VRRLAAFDDLGRARVHALLEDELERSFPSMPSAIASTSNAFPVSATNAVRNPIETSDGKATNDFVSATARFETSVVCVETVYVIGKGRSVATGTDVAASPFASTAMSCCMTSLVTFGSLSGYVHWRPNENASKPFGA
jgi:hypothetical protein